MHNRMGITPGRLLAALADYHLWPVSVDILFAQAKILTPFRSSTSLDVSSLMPLHPHLTMTDKNPSAQLHSSKSTRDVLDAIPPPNRLQPRASLHPPLHIPANPCTVHHEPPHHPRHSHRLLHSPAAHLDLRPRQRASFDWHDTEYLDSALHHRTSSLDWSWHKGACLADVLAVDCAAELSLLSRYCYVCIVPCR